MKQIFFLFSLILSFIFQAYPQTKLNNNRFKNKTYIPKILVIPFIDDISGKEDIRKILDENANLRIAVNKTKEAFQKKGFKTVDFITTLKAAEDKKIFLSQSNLTIKSQIIELSGVDIYVQVELKIKHEDTATSISLVLRGNEAITWNNLSANTGESGKLNTNDISVLISKALENCFTDFIKYMNEKYNKIVRTGNTLMINLTFDDSSKFNASSKLGQEGLPLSVLLEKWMMKNAYKGLYNASSSEDESITIYNVQIPYIIPKTGKKYLPDLFVKEFGKYLNDLGLSFEKSITRGIVDITIK
ncbi:MAG: DUF6175 family protein [Bacteroidota bacterium]|nr:DUF6175 family protein [Bacteroidota bacterium]